MKVLLINKYHYRKGGAETFYFNLADILKEAGHDVVFFSMKHEKNVECVQENYFVSNKEYNEKTSIFKKIKAFSSLVYSKEAYKKVSRLIQNEKPDIAILNNIHRQLTTSVVDALYNNKVKMYWVVHDLIMLCPNYQMLDNEGCICEKCCSGDYKNCIKKKCVKKSKLKSYLAYKEAVFNKKHHQYEKVDCFITPSAFYRNKLIEYGFDEKKIKHVPNPLVFDFSNTPQIYDEGYFLYFGRLSREKGILTLIEAVKNTNHKLLILGTGPLEKELKDSAVGCSNIEFKGYQSGDSLTNLIKKSRCVVLPSEWYENGPYSAMEAMCLGKPLIVSKLGGLPELVDDGVNGFVFDKKDNLQECLNKMVSLNESEYKKMSLCSFKKAKEMFDAKTYLSRSEISD